MTSSAQPATESAPAKWSFKLCDGNHQGEGSDHGHFWDPDGKATSGSFFSTPSALAALENGIARGVPMMKESLEELLAQISQANLPWQSDQWADPTDNMSLGLLVLAIDVQRGDYQPSTKRKFIVKVEGSKPSARFVDEDGTSSLPVHSKKIGRMSLSLGILAGILAAESRDRLLAEIASAELPEDDEGLN